MTTKPLLAYRWELLFWLWLAFFFNQADRQVFSTVLPLIKSDLKITDVQAGWIATIFTAALAVTVPIAGYVGDICNRAKIISWSLFGWSLSTLLSGFGSTFGYLVGIRSVATGVGEAFYAPAANALIGEHHHETRGRAMAIHQTSLYAGVIASGLVAGWIADHYGWRAAFWVFGGFGIVLAALTAWRLKSGTGASERVHVAAPRLREILAVLRRPTVLMLVAAWACMVFVNIAYLTWMPTYLHEQFGLNLANAGFSSMAYHHLGAFGGVILGGLLADRLAVDRLSSRLVLQGLALFAGAPFLWLLGTQSSVGLLYGALAGFGFFRGIYDAGIYASLFEVIEPRLRASVLGLVIALVYLFGAIAPVLLGWLKGAVGLSLSFSLLAVVYAVGGTAALIGAKVFFTRDHALAKPSAA
jgi:MFS family permease